MEEKRKKRRSGRRHGRRGKRRNAAGILSNIVLAAALAVFCVSAFQLYKICKGYYDGRSEYSKVRELAL